MSLSLVQDNNVVELRGLDGTFRRPHGAGLLPGRVIAGWSSRAQAEGTLSLRATALASAIASNWPRGYWHWNEAASVLTWLGSRTDAHAPLKLPPPTHVRLPSALALLAEDDIVLAHGLLLSSGSGWSENMSAEGVAFALMRKVKNYVGVAAVFTTSRGKSSDIDAEWVCELYTNGMVWADTNARLNILCRHLSTLALASAPDLGS